MLPSAHTDTFCRDHLPPAGQWPELSGHGWQPAYPEQLNLGAVLLEETIARHGADRVAVIGDEVTFTYGELLAESNRLARVLTLECGLVPGNRVLIWGHNSPWLAAVWLAVLRAGGVAVPVSPLLTAVEVDTQREVTRAGHVVVSARLAGRVDGAVVYGSSDDDDLLVRARRHPGDFTPVATSQDDVAFLVSTSGTTGKPKVTAHFHRDLLAIADTYCAHALRPTPDDVFTGTPHLSFTYGLGGRLVFPLRTGAATVLMEETSTVALRDSIVKHRATVCVSSPAAYRGLAAMAHPELLGSIRVAVSSGEALPASVWTTFRDATGIEILEALGTTECTQTFTSNVAGDVRPGSVGRPLPGYVVEIWDEQGRPVPPGVPGRFAVKGPTGCRYLDDPRQTSYVQRGWNVTGDIFSRDADGFLWYHGRADDLINSAGHKVYPVEIENELLRHPLVRECMVNGSAVGGVELITAHVVRADDAMPDAELQQHLRTFLSGRLAPYKIPRVITFVPSLTRGITGKLRRNA